MKVDGKSLVYSSTAPGLPTTYQNGRTYTLAWNGSGGELTSATVGDATTSFSYFYGGLRKSKTSGGVTKNYYYDGSRLIAEKWSTGAYLLYHYDENGSIYAITYSSTGSGYAKYYLLKNIQGDVVQIRNSTNGITANYEYDAWGNVISVTYDNGNAVTVKTEFALINPIRYRGYYYDSETGFYYLQSRYYDPANCRFVSADGQMDLSDGTTNLNLFAYCGNDPVNRIDPEGKLWWLIPVIIVPILLTSCSNSSEVYPELPPTKKEPTFTSTDDAAIYAANEFYSFTKYSGREYGAAIYKNSDESCYRLTSTSTGTDRDVLINTSEVEDGNIVGYVHSHPRQSPFKFSDDDFYTYYQRTKLVNYVVEPYNENGKLYKYNPFEPTEPIFISIIRGRELSVNEKRIYKPWR